MVWVVAITALASSIAAQTPLALLRIPRIGLHVPVLAGTDEGTLKRAAGHIEDTTRPGEEGNSGIAGHRDGVFRALKHVRAGDVIELETRGGVERYRVERTWVVNPEDVSVLDPTTLPSLTLVTCYPFSFVGSAPQRFIVRAVRRAPQ
jgi:sortase A